jgi:hypothetical protein
MVHNIILYDPKGIYSPYPMGQKWRISMKKKIGSFIFFISIFISIYFPVLGDDHILVERTMSYMGHIYPKRINEYWITDNNVYLKSGSFVTITRYDLKKRWIIFPDQKKYVEESISITKKETKSNQSIHETGWDYNPAYDWIIKKSDRKQDINGWECQEIIADGDADYAEKNIEIWVSKDIPINIQHFNDLVQRTNEEWAGIFQTFPELKKLFIVKTRQTIVNAIAPAKHLENKVIKAEIAEPPQNIYDLSEGLEKLNSLKELYRQ